MLKLPLLLKYVCLPDVMLIFFLQAEEISPEQEEKLWESGAFGAHSPRALRASLWYLTTKCLGMRGRQESRQLKWGDFTRKTDEWGNEFLEFNERTRKLVRDWGTPAPFTQKCGPIAGTLRDAPFICTKNTNVIGPMTCVSQSPPLIWV